LHYLLCQVKGCVGNFQTGAYLDQSWMERFHLTKRASTSWTFPQTF
jgi:hypothetical protein